MMVIASLKLTFTNAATLKGLHLGRAQVGIDQPEAGYKKRKHKKPSQ
jgi:hypothetical protein